jgi:hypothetical protein
MGVRIAQGPADTIDAQPDPACIAQQSGRFAMPQDLDPTAPADFEFIMGDWRVLHEQSKKGRHLAAPALRITLNAPISSWPCRPACWL